MWQIIPTYVPVKGEIVYPYKDGIILTVDKGVAVVVKDRQNYIKKLSTYYNNWPTDRYPQILDETAMDDLTYRTMYLTGTSSPKFYGLH